MKRFYMLLLASAVLLPGNTFARADAKCGFPKFLQADDAIYDCWDGAGEDETGVIKFQYEDLTPEERIQIANIRARVDGRLDEKWALEQAEWRREEAQKAERERVRISQCTVPLLRIGCPQKEAR